MNDSDRSTASGLLRVRAFVLLLTTRTASNTSNQMLGVVVGYQVYELTNSAFHLGLIGLVQFMPPLLLILLTGQVADRFNRRLVLRCCYTVECAMAAGLLLVALQPRPSVQLIYGLLLVNACARTFEVPCVQALVTAMVPRELLGRIVTAHVLGNRIAMLLGPALGGVLYLLGPAAAYGASMVLVLTAATASFLYPNPPAAPQRRQLSVESLFGGFRFLWHCQIVLGAMLFDLVAVMFGAVTALLPIFARDILHIGPFGNGILRSAQAVGALMIAAVLTRFPITRNGGAAMFLGFAVFGAATIVFGLSTSVTLSVIALMVVGAGDMVSSVVRQTIMQITTPDDMRGRVFAVNAMFLGTSAQLGAFQSGIMAALIGGVPAVVVGGCAVLATVALWTKLFPGLRRVDRPDEPQPY